MATSNQEILAQLEKLAEGKLSGEMVSCYSHSRSAVSYYADLADFPAILAAVKRWVKIEEAAKAWRRVQRTHSEAISTGNGRGETGLGISRLTAMHNEELVARNTLDAALSENTDVE